MRQGLPGGKADGGVRPEQVTESGGEVIGLMAGRRDREYMLLGSQGGGHQRPDGGRPLQLKAGGPYSLGNLRQGGVGQHCLQQTGQRHRK